jgi:hypothetical protein
MFEAPEGWVSTQRAYRSSLRACPSWWSKRKEQAPEAIAGAGDYRFEEMYGRPLEMASALRLQVSFVLAAKG